MRAFAWCACAAALALLLGGAGCKKNKNDTTTPNEAGGLVAPGEGTGEEGGGESGSGSPMDSLIASGGTDEAGGADTAGPPPDLADVGSAEKISAGKLADEGAALLAAGNEAGAEAKFAEALELDPKQAMAAYNLGVAAERKGGVDKARKLYEQAYTAVPGYGPAVAAAAHLSLKTGGPKKALTFVQPFATKYPDAAPIQNAYGAILVENDQPGKATEVAKGVLKADEKNVKAMIVLGRAYHKSGQDETARYVLSEALKQDPSDGEIYYAFSLIDLDAKEKKLAVAHLKKAVELTPSLLDARNNLAVLYLDGGSFQEAADQLAAAAKLAPYKGEVFLNLGEAYRGLRQWKDAIGAYEKAEKLGVPGTLISFNLGLLYYSADAIEGMSRKDILKKAQSYFIKYRDAAGPKAAAQDTVNVDEILKLIDAMIKKQEAIEKKKAAAAAAPAEEEGEGGE